MKRSGSPHLVTAHGLNLGLMGAATLAGLVTRAAAGGRDIGSDGLLRRYDIEHRRASWPIYAATNAIDRLESAILAKAFRGELVPQDPNDEPASVLLDRIRAERAAAPKANRGRAAGASA